jgi:hypothetical protein
MIGELVGRGGLLGQTLDIFRAFSKNAPQRHSLHELSTNLMSF